MKIHSFSLDLKYKVIIPSGKQSLYECKACTLRICADSIQVHCLGFLLQFYFYPQDDRAPIRAGLHSFHTDPVGETTEIELM